MTLKERISFIIMISGILGIVAITSSVSLSVWGYFTACLMVVEFVLFLIDKMGEKRN